MQADFIRASDEAQQLINHLEEMPESEQKKKNKLHDKYISQNLQHYVHDANAVCISLCFSAEIKDGLMPDMTSEITRLALVKWYLLQWLKLMLLYINLVIKCLYCISTKYTDILIVQKC